MVSKHIARIRTSLGYKASRFFIYVERNLGFEAGMCWFLGFLCFMPVTPP
jgi:hypothetical protein